MNQEAAEDLTAARRHRCNLWLTAYGASGQGKKYLGRGRPVRRFEALLIDTLGEDWRAIRDECPTINTENQRTKLARLKRARHMGDLHPGPD